MTLEQEFKYTCQIIPSWTVIAGMTMVTKKKFVDLARFEVNVTILQGIAYVTPCTVTLTAHTWHVHIPSAMAEGRVYLVVSASVVMRYLSSIVALVLNVPTNAPIKEFVSQVARVDVTMDSSDQTVPLRSLFLVPPELRSLLLHSKLSWR